MIINKRIILGKISIKKFAKLNSFKLSTALKLLKSKILLPRKVYEI